MEQLTRAFVTHLHSDRTADLPDLILTPAVTGRREPEIYGPPGLRAMVGHVILDPAVRSRPARIRLWLPQIQLLRRSPCG